MAEQPITPQGCDREVEGSSPSPGTHAPVAKRFGTESNDLNHAGSNPAGRTKLYAVVHSGLPPGAKACQAAHALRAYADAYPEIERAWWAESNTLVMLETDRLEELEHEAHAKAVSCVRFVEPDWAPEGTLTALVLGPDAKRLTNKLQLAFR